MNPGDISCVTGASAGPFGRCEDCGTKFPRRICVQAFASQEILARKDGSCLLGGAGLSSLYGTRTAVSGTRVGGPGGAAALAQQATFKAGTSIVAMLSTVIDAQGRLVPSLDQEDFTILDNGKPQEITFFQNETQPFTVVVMLDFSASMTANLDLLKAATEQFILRMLPDDKGQVGAFSDKIEFSGTFTNDRDDLIGALKDLQFGNPTRLYDAIDASIDMLDGAAGRRKIVLVFTDGDDTASRKGQGDVLQKARAKETMIYAIGLESEFFNGIRRPADPARPRPAQACRRDRRRLFRAEEDRRPRTHLHARRAGAA